MDNATRALLRAAYYVRVAKDNEARSNEALRGERPADDSATTFYDRAQLDWLCAVRALLGGA